MKTLGILFVLLLSFLATPLSVQAKPLYYKCSVFIQIGNGENHTTIVGEDLKVPFNGMSVRFGEGKHWRIGAGNTLAFSKTNVKFTVGLVEGPNFYSGLMNRKSKIFNSVFSLGVLPIFGDAEFNLNVTCKEMER